MSVAERIERKLAEALEPDHLEVVDESGGHNVPPGSESHFKVVLVAQAFAGERLLNRHRMVNAVLAEELAHDIHALAIHTYTRDEWRRRFGNAPLSPPCLGGKRLEAAGGGAGEGRGGPGG
ncbi:MAG: BolA/IbaG family iron-sulfur metabolism protein [Gammaproteobacteria bacterium]|nr:BolA/IbaG family iron-sulfur metabolism protein [Gammaproteobacteria bacterium]MDE0365502.1 BolA/IbaG family iron-sulfur metabolism protein [Gammaproteobacteria bacterium]